MRLPFGKILKVLGKIARIITAAEDILKEKERKQNVKEIRKRLNK